jgi:signal transduction histidine kinase
LWIGTRDVGLLHLRGGQVATVGRPQGLGSDSVTGIVPDGRGSLWLTTAGDGMVRVDEAALLAVAGGRASIDPLVLTTRDGLPSDGTASRAPPAGGVDRAGRLWLASYRGAVVFPRPASVAPALPRLPSPRIDSVRVDGHQIALPGSGEARLAMGRGELQVRYTAVLFEGRERLRFRHRLEGFDRGWRDAGDAQEADYTGLPAGRYRFHVASYFAGAAGTGPETVFAFALIPPFYRTRLFFAGLSLLLAAAVALGWRLRVRQVRRRLVLISHERNRIAREIHDSLEQTLYAAKLQLEVAGGQPARRGPHLTRGIELVERAIDEARAAVWALRTGVFGRADLSVAISVTAGDSLRHSQVAFALETEGAPFKISALTQWHIGQTVRESFTNALKHGKPSKVTVRLVYGPRLVVSVMDDGVGLAAPVEGDSSGHYGLQGMRERLRACGGTVTLDSPPGGGTTVRIEVPREVSS